MMMDMTRKFGVLPEFAGGHRADYLLTGLMVDAAGRPMSLEMSVGRSAASRQYVGDPAIEPVQRIGAARVERNAIVLLQSLHLIGKTYRSQQVAAVLRRVVVCPDRLVFQLDRRACAAEWRKQALVPPRTPIAMMLRLVAGWLPPGLSAADVGRMLCITAPRRSRPRRSAGTAG